MNAEQLERIKNGKGFFAALDQSGGSTPKALGEYGISEDRYSGDEQMFDLVHAMRSRVVSDPAFDGSRILAAILFEQTMDREIEGQLTGDYLWHHKNVVPILKVDKGLANESDDVQLMKPIDTLDDLIERGLQRGMFGTKMRSVIKEANPSGIDAVADQQFQLGKRIAAAGLVPILEPEVSIDSPSKQEAEDLLHDALLSRLQEVPETTRLMFKLSLPSQAGLYADLAADPRVVRVLALSGGYARNEACQLLARDPAMIASFSRALLDGLRADQSDEEFHEMLDRAITEIYAASVNKSV